MCVYNSRERATLRVFMRACMDFMKPSATVAFLRYEEDTASAKWVDLAEMC